MHRQVVGYYGDDGRAREMELAAAERRTSCCSCSPLGKIFSRAITGAHNGRRDGPPRRRRSKKQEVVDYATAYPPAEAYYVRPNARTITVTATNNDHHQHPVDAQVHSVPPESPRSYAAVPGAHPHAGGAGKPRKKKKKKRVTFNPEAAAGGPMTMPANAHAGHAPQHAAMAASSTGAAGGSAYHHGGGAEPYSPAPPPVHAHAYGYGRYVPSPLTRREAMVGTPRPHKYFSGEYRWYYPTPVRESIYCFATDANHRLTAFFSEENPNACTIV